MAENLIGDDQPKEIKEEDLPAAIGYIKAKFEDF